jgi:hypothetical protein
VVQKTLLILPIRRIRCIDHSFAWEAKVGLDYSLSEAVQLVADVRYGALTEFPDQGIFAATVGFRFYPGF